MNAVPRVVPAVFIVLTLCESLSAAPAVPHPRIVMVVAPRDFTDREYADPRSVFENAGAVVRVASTEKGPAVSHDGEKLSLDCSVGELRLDQFDALVIVGGPGAVTYLMDNEGLRSLVVAAARSRRVVAGICVAPAVLARAGVLRNIPATCYSDKRIVAVLKLNGADYRDTSVVVAGRIVTANGPDAAKDFGLRVMETIGGMAK